MSDAIVRGWDKVKTSRESLPDGWSEAAKLKEILDGFDYVVLYRIDGVSIDKASECEFLGDGLPEDFLEMRAFSMDAELHVIKVGDSPLGRVRRDNGGDDIEVLNEEHLLWGKPHGAVGNSGKVLLTEDRGTRLLLPPEAAPKSENKVTTIWVRSYVAPEPDWDNATADMPVDFQFDDWRLVCFDEKGADEEERE
jgi:CRISPR-associated protein (TIGR03984 family)